jgi:hypothetical protein
MHRKGDHWSSMAQSRDQEGWYVVFVCSKWLSVNEDIKENNKLDKFIAVKKWKILIQNWMKIGEKVGAWRRSLDVTGE